MEAVMTTTTAWPDPSTSDAGTVYYIPDTIAPKTVTLAAKARVNKSTLASGHPNAIVEKIRKDLIKDLMEQLVTQNLVKLSSDVANTSGRVTFTCTLEVVDPREQST